MFDIPIFIYTVLSTIAEQKRLLPSLVYTQSSSYVHASLTEQKRLLPSLVYTQSSSYVHASLAEKKSFSLAFAEKSTGIMKKKYWKSQRNLRVRKSGNYV